MSLKVIVPEVGESITDVTIAVWNKKDGDHVVMDEILCELESEKATFELPAEAEGKLKIVAKEGDTLEIGAVICEIDTDAKPANSQPDSSAQVPVEDEVPAISSTEKTGKVIEMHVPEVGESITEVTLGSWTKEEGSFVELDEIIAEIESEKATFELPAEATGILKQVAKDEQVLQIGDLICTIEESTAPNNAEAKREEVPTVTNQAQGVEGYAKGHASPAAAKILDEKGVDPKSVQGSGVDGRITKEDAQSASKEKQPGTKPAATSEQPLPVAGERNETRKKMSSLRKTVARRLVAVKNETAMLTTFNEVDMKPVMDLRAKYKEQFKEKHDIGLGFMSFFIKACTVALQEWPSVNAMIDGDEMVFHDFCDVSIAVSAPKGLVVPVIRNAEGLDFPGIEKEVKRLALKARDNKLTIPEMTGGTFTITNGGIFGSMMSTPIINSPQSAILGMHNIVERAVPENGEVVIKPMMYLALSYDHRIIDGRESVGFLVRVKELLEDPSRLLLNV
ncbi:MAG: dihydrolipoamide succinyltransferase [Bacteroidetes bacterium]|nr:MAG: dihydrolipoamide succinyltransferase [Bacteroidota bacterium]